MDTQMERTQVYLPSGLKRRLKKQAHRTGVNVSEALRRGAEKWLTEEENNVEQHKKRFRKALHAMAGMWKDRDDIDFEEIRARGNRIFPGWNDGQ